MVPQSTLAGHVSDRYRVEHDLLGDKEVPVEAFWGVHTARALENFAISGRTLGDFPTLVEGIVSIKLASARANRSLGCLPDHVADAIDRACTAILEGAYADQFVVDPVQGGAGTSANMNANEVIANVALAQLGETKGRYDVIHPVEHVNLSQSTNDVYPTAVRIAVMLQARSLLDQLDRLRLSFTTKADEFVQVLKVGRTQLQDAVPMTLGQEFGAFAVLLHADTQRLREALGLLQEINLGATAIGTTLNAPDGYSDAVRAELITITGLTLTTAPNLIAATQDVGALVQVSGALKSTCVKLSKICNDLRLLSSGPRAGLGEIRLPAVQAGSSIMPGKVNPVIPEVMNQVAFDVIGQDVTIGLAAEAGQLQLNAFEPIIARSLLTSLRHMTAACETLRVRCIDGIMANEGHLRESALGSIGLAAALNPRFGYVAATEIAQHALHSGRTIVDIVMERSLLDPAEVTALLDPDSLTNGARSPGDSQAPTPT